MEGTEAENDPFHFTVGLVDHVLVVRCVPFGYGREKEEEEEKEKEGKRVGG